MSLSFIVKTEHSEHYPSDSIIHFSLMINGKSFSAARAIDKNDESNIEILHTTISFVTDRIFDKVKKTLIPESEQLTIHQEKPALETD